MTQTLQPGTILIVATAPLCWAGNFVLARHLGGEVPPIQLNFCRWLLAGIILTPFAWRARAAVVSAVRSHWRVFARQALCGVALYHCLVYYALTLTGAINATLINSMVPVLIPLIAFVAFGKSVSKRSWVAVAISTLGVLLVVTRGELGNLAGLAFNIGDLMMFAAAMTWATYTLLLGQKPGELSGPPFLWVLCLFGVAMLTPFYAWDLATNGFFAQTAENWLSVCYVAVFASVVAFLAWNHGAARMAPAKLGMFAHLIPVFGVIMATVLLNERFLLSHGIGMALIAGGLWIAFHGMTSKASPQIATKEGKPRC